MKILNFLKRTLARKADYRDAKPEQVARAVLKYRLATKDKASLSRTDQATRPRSVRQP